MVDSASLLLREHLNASGSFNGHSLPNQLLVAAPRVERQYSYLTLRLLAALIG